MKSITVNGWKWKEAGTDEWTPCAHQKPITEIYTDLLDAGKIPDPFVDRNERQVQWVAEKDWEYSAEFQVDDVAAHAHHDLVFEGLDTIATVYLNGEQILKSDNMFHIHRVPVKVQAKNELKILFESALNYGYKLADKYGHVTVFNGDDTRAYVRKAQYHYGWDWGPVLMTCGPFKPVRLESYSKTNITDVYVDGDVHEDLSADVTVNATIQADSQVEGKVELIDPAGNLVSSGPLNNGQAKFRLDKPQLWYPIGYGKQDRYTVKVTVDDQTVEKVVGLRRAELVERPLKDAPGSSFFIQVNNIPIFSQGSNWIPAHNFLTKLSNEDYYKWIDRAVDSNQNMIRVWGGGIYEPDEFYAECDRVGILIWQDFMFACGQYPYYPEFRKSVCRELEDQLKRLRNFASIVIYAGNNEDYQVAEQVGLEWNPEDKNGDYTTTNFPARTAYETDMPHYVKSLTRVPYHPGSPWGGKGSGDPTIGDNHQWNVWHGSQEKYQNWAKLASRFVSEFGMLAFPHRETINKCITDPEEQYPQSIVMDSHCKADGFIRRLALYVMENIKVLNMDMDSWIYATQLMQHECIAYAYRCWRRDWRGPGREYVAGALVWQINDCWPVSSWAIVDYYGHKKLSYFAVKRECAPINVGIYRTTTEEKHAKLKPPAPGPPHDLKDKKYIFDVWGVNSTLEPVKCALELKTFNVRTGELVKHYGYKQVELLPNQSTEIHEDLDVDQECVIQARLINSSPVNLGVEGKQQQQQQPDASVDALVMARTGDWPQPLKYLKMPDRQLVTTVRDGRVELTAARPVKGVRLTIADDLRADWKDNGVDVFPGETVVVEAPGLRADDEVRAEYYH